MSRMKVVLASLVAMFAVSAVAAGPAAATTKNEYFEGGGATQITSEKIEATVGVADLQSEIASAKVLIECTNNKFSEGEISTGGASKGKIEYSSCTISEIKEGKRSVEATCTVKVPAF